MDHLLAEIRGCTTCAKHLPLGPRPVVAAHPNSRILVIGQAPGTRVHATGIPWNDPSGKRLRSWLQVTDAQFYNPELFGIVPMGFCYPGKGTSGDLPPRTECAPQWHPPLLEQMPHVKLTLLIGMYAQRYYLGDKAGATLTETVRDQDLESPYFCLPHPSPRNIRWLKRNDWFEINQVPVLQARVAELLIS